MKKNKDCRYEKCNAILDQIDNIYTCSYCGSAEFRGIVLSKEEIDHINKIYPYKKTNHLEDWLKCQKEEINHVNKTNHFEAKTKNK